MVANNADNTVGAFSTSDLIAELKRRGEEETVLEGMGDELFFNSSVVSLPEATASLKEAISLQYP